MTTESDIKRLIASGEQIDIEFKSDRKCLPDRDLLAAVVAMTNTEGGDLLLGVEDNGDITGLHPNHQDTTRLAALISNKTIPPLSVRVERIDMDGTLITHIRVPKSRQLVATSEGLLQRRRILADGTPTAVPFYPHEFVQRQSAMGLTDPSAMVFQDLSSDIFNPLERERMRETIRRHGGDTALLPLSDDELDGALGLTTMSEGIRRPTLAGLLFIGRETVLRQYVPAHEAAFQVLEGTDVRMNDFFRAPLLKLFEAVEGRFAARRIEKEFQVGLFRVPIPNFDQHAFREGFINALIHRDYNRLGSVHIRITDDGLTISNPGGFVEGVTLQNLLITEPRPRNPLLADISKRIGLAERTGRGIDRIYEGLLKYGRPAPDYGRSNDTSVILRMSSTEADFAFLEMILNEEARAQRNMPLDSLIVLSRLRQERRLAGTDLMQSTQKPEHETRGTLEKLVESGLVDAHGSGRGRTYTLSASVYRKSRDTAGYIRQAGFGTIQQEQMVLNYLDTRGRIKRADVIELCRISPAQAYHLLRRLKEKGSIVQHGEKRHTFYTRKT